MNKQKTFFSLVFISSFIFPLMAEEEGTDKILFSAKKIFITSVTTYGGLVVGLVGGLAAGCTIMQDKDTLPTSGAKIAICAVLGATSGTIAGKNIGRKYIEHYYPKEK